MATATAIAIAIAPATQNASNRPASNASQKPYDPMKVLEGMYSGSVVRLGYALQDPKNYSESTKIIIAECTKKFQDTLDDCENQILDAKWYLEQKLAENKARREAEAKAKEASIAPTSVKRKHDEVEEISEHQQEEGTPTKRVKSGEQPSPKSTPAVTSLPMKEDQPSPPDTTQQPSRPVAQPQPQPQAQAMARSQSQSKEPPKPPEQEKPKLEEKKQPEKIEETSQPEPQSQQDQYNTDDFTKPTPQATPALTNDDFNFESMFEGSLEENNDATNTEDIAFGGIDDGFDQFGPPSTTINNTDMNSASNTQSQTQPTTQLQQPQAIRSQSQTQPPLLQGLEQFANQPDDSQTQHSTTHLTSHPMQNQPSNLSNMSNTSNPFTSNEPNIWDSILGDDMNFDGADFGAVADMNSNTGNVNSNANMNMNMNIDNPIQNAGTDDMENMNITDPGIGNEEVNWDEFF